MKKVWCCHLWIQSDLWETPEELSCTDQLTQLNCSGSEQECGCLQELRTLCVSSSCCNDSTASLCVCSADRFLSDSVRTWRGYASLLRLTLTRGGSRKWLAAHSAGFVRVHACVRLVVVGEQFVQVGHPLLRVLSFQQRVHQVTLRGETPWRHVVSEWHLMLLLTHCLAHLVSLVTL